MLQNRLVGLWQLMHWLVLGQQHHSLAKPSLGYADLTYLHLALTCSNSM